MITNEDAKKTSLDLYEHYTKTKAVESNDVPYFRKDAVHIHIPKAFKYNLIETIDVINLNGRFPYLCYRINDLPYNTTKKAQRKNREIRNIDALTLVDQGILKPFLFFFRRKLIKLSQIKVWDDGRNVHIIFPYDFYNTDEFDGSDEDVDILLFPKEVLYNEEGEYYDTNVIQLAFAFNDEGLFDFFGNTRIYIDTNDDYIFRWGSSTYGIVKDEDISVDDSIHLRPEYVICFKKGELYKEAKVEFNPYNCLTIDDGKNVGIDDIYYRIFYDLDCVEEYNLLDIGIVHNHNMLKEMWLGSLIRNDVDRESLELPYDYKLDPELSFEENMDNFFRYTLDYNEYLIINEMPSNNIVCVKLDNNLIQDGEKTRTYIAPKKLLPSCRTILFVNGVMSSNRIIKNNPYGIIYNTEGLSGDDAIEFVSFRLEGEYSYFTLRKEVSDYSVNIGTDQFNLFVLKDHPDKQFEMIYEDELYYPVDAEDWIYDKSSKTIHFNTERYNDETRIYIKPRKTFAHYHETIQEESYRVILSSDFHCCNNENHYIIFVNGIRLNSAMYRVVVPQTDKPFNKYAIYTHVILRVGDEVDVVYSPISIIDEVYIEDLDHSMEMGTGIDHLGFINGPVDYDIPLHVNIQFFFIDGKKVPISYLSNIDHNTVRLIKDTGSVQELSILNPDEEQVEAIRSLNIGTSVRDAVFDKMNKDTINIMTGKYAYISSEGLEMRADISKTELIHAIVRDFYTQVNKGVPMVYTYDAETFTEVDSGGNIVLDVVDGTVLHNVAFEED